MRLGGAAAIDLRIAAAFLGPAEGTVTTRGSTPPFDHLTVRFDLGGGLRGSSPGPDARVSESGGHGVFWQVRCPFALTQV